MNNIANLDYASLWRLHHQNPEDARIRAEISQRDNGRSDRQLQPIRDERNGRDLALLVDALESEIDKANEAKDDAEAESSTLSERSEKLDAENERLRSEVERLKGELAAK